MTTDVCIFTKRCFNVSENTHFRFKTVIFVEVILCSGDFSLSDLIYQASEAYILLLILKMDVKFSIYEVQAKSNWPGTKRSAQQKLIEATCELVFAIYEIIILTLK